MKKMSRRVYVRTPAKPNLPSWSRLGWKGHIKRWSTDDDFDSQSLDRRVVYTVSITPCYTTASLQGSRRKINAWFLRDLERFKDHLHQPMLRGWSRDNRLSLAKIRIGSEGKWIPWSWCAPEGYGSVVYQHTSNSERSLCTHSHFLKQDSQR